MIKRFLPDEIKVKINIADSRLPSNLITIKTTRFTKKSFFNSTLGFTQSHFGAIGDIESIIQLIPGTYKSNKPNNFTGTVKVHLKCDCINGSILNGCRQPILYNFSMDKPPGEKLFQEPRVKLLKRSNKSLFSHI